MSLVFNAINTDFKGIVQIAEKEMGKTRGFLSGNTDRLKEFTAEVNLAWDDYVDLAFRSSGTQQFDDTNHQDSSGNSTFPVIKAHLTSGRRDYKVLTDEQSNLIIGIHKVAILPSATATLYKELSPMDEFSDLDNDIITESAGTGVPSRYAKIGDTILLDTPANYTTTGTNYGLKVYISREPSYFISTDTSKMPGCPGIHHRYFALKPALSFARQNNLATYNKIREEVVSFEGDEEKNITGSIERYFSRREKDVRTVMTPQWEPYE